MKFTILLFTFIALQGCSTQKDFYGHDIDTKKFHYVALAQKPIDSKKVSQNKRNIELDKVRKKPGRFKKEYGTRGIAIGFVPYCEAMDQPIPMPCAICLCMQRDAREKCESGIDPSLVVISDIIGETQMADNSSMSGGGESCSERYPDSLCYERGYGCNL